MGTSTTFNNAYNTFATQFMGMAVSVARSAVRHPAANVRYQVFQESSSQQIDALVESIVVEHTWPYNAVVAQAQFEAVAMGGYTRPFNISLESDQIALRNAYFALFPPTSALRTCRARCSLRAASRRACTRLRRRPSARGRTATNLAGAARSFGAREPGRGSGVPGLRARVLGLAPVQHGAHRGVRPRTIRSGPRPCSGRPTSSSSTPS